MLIVFTLRGRDVKPLIQNTLFQFHRIYKLVNGYSRRPFLISVSQKNAEASKIKCPTTSVT